MKLKTILASSLIFFSAYSYAEWVLVTSSADNSNKYYIESNSVKKVGGTFRAWGLVDYSARNNFGNLSHKAYFEIDCIESRIRNLSYTFYKGSMGMGEASSFTPEKIDWSYASPESINEYIVKYVCMPRWN